MIKLQFFGATQTTTGSKYLLSTDRHQLLVDCGLFQGKKELRVHNWEPFPLPVAPIEAVVLTHAHLDHCGYIPLFIRQGFQGPIYCTEATRDLAEIILRDAGRIQEEEARRANQYGYSKHKPALPLYTEVEAVMALERFKVVPFGVDFSLGKGMTVTFSRAGHILGSSILTFRYDGTTVVFSGDLGRPHDPIMKRPAQIQTADYLVLESTYGDRLHPKTNPKEELKEIILSTAKKGGTVLIPSFAVGRTQMILYFLHQLKLEKQIPDLPVYLDSPMAQDASDIMCKHAKEHDLPSEECHAMCQMATYVKTKEESKALDRPSFPSVIIAGSGMAEGGRILHHLKYFGPQPQNTIIFVGYQAAMTRGERILRGEKEIKIQGEIVPMRLRVERIESLSSHADYEEILEWLKDFQTAPTQTFLTHGEETSANHLKNVIEKELKWRVTVPSYGELFRL